MQIFARLRSWWAAREPNPLWSGAIMEAGGARRCSPQELAAFKWLEPWSSIDDATASFSDTFVQQLRREIRRGHQLYDLPVRLIGRGNGDNALFEIQDGTGRVAVVHLVWQGRQKLPWPDTRIYTSLASWQEKCMIPENREWKDE